MRRKSEKGESNIWRNNGQKFSKTNEKKEAKSQFQDTQRKPDKNKYNRTKLHVT